MKSNRIIFICLIFALLIVACAPKAALLDKKSGEMNSGGGNVVVSEPNLPNNLNSLYQSDLGDLDGAPIYSLEISLNPDGDNYRVSGTEQVIYTNLESVPLEEIYFKLIPNMGGDYLSVFDVRVDSLVVDPWLEFNNSVMRVNLPEVLKPGRSTTIEMQIDLVVPSLMGGNYGLFVYSENILALDAFFPIIPVYNDEGWNVEAPPQNADVIFSDASFFRVIVDAPREMVLATGGREVERQIESARQIVTYEAGPQREFYLAASPDFVSQSVDVDGVTVTSYYLESYAQSGKDVLDTAAIALQGFNQRFGDYPFTELDLVSTPMQAGGMEYSSITALGLYLYDPENTLSSGLPVSAFLEAATAHEIAHMWFYSQVMNDQIDHPWQDESLVQYATYLYYLDRYGEDSAEGFKSSFYDRWDRVNREAIPIGLPAPAYVGLEYGAIIYGWGPLMFDAMRGTMGESVFDQFLLDYVTKYRWKTVEPEDFLDLAEETCECDLSAIYEEWGVKS